MDALMVLYQNYPTVTLTRGFFPSIAYSPWLAFLFVVLLCFYEGCISSQAYMVQARLFFHQVAKLSVVQAITDVVRRRKVLQLSR